MKTIPKYIALAICSTVFLLAGCAVFEAQVAKLKTDLSALVSNPSSAANQAAVASDVTAIVGDTQTAYNSLSGLAVVYQAYVGTGLPVPASVASDAASVTKVGSAVQTVLSKVEATQAVANGLFAAAAAAQPTSAMLNSKHIEFDVFNPDNQVNNLSVSKEATQVRGKLTVDSGTTRFAASHDSQQNNSSGTGSNPNAAHISHAQFIFESPGSVWCRPISRAGAEALFVGANPTASVPEFISESLTLRPAIASDWRYVVASRDKANF